MSNNFGFDNEYFDDLFDKVIVVEEIMSNIAFTLLALFIANLVGHGFWFACIVFIGLTLIDYVKRL
jgi:small basic protein